MPHCVSRSFPVRRARLRSLAPRYQHASPAQKTLLLDACVASTGYTRKHAIELLNHGKQEQQTIQRHRLPQYSQTVQQALLQAWKATHYVCAKRLLPFLPSLVALLERQGRLQLMEEERRQMLAMSVSTAERFLRTAFAWSVYDHAWSAAQSADPRVSVLPMGGGSPRLCRDGPGGPLWGSSRWTFSVYSYADRPRHRLD